MLMNLLVVRALVMINVPSYFGNACPSANQEQVRACLHVNISCFDKYLRVPTPQCRMSNGKFQNLQTSMTEQLIQWGDGHFSTAWEGGAYQISCTSTPHVHYGCFQTTLCGIRDLTRMARNLYWGSKKGS